MSFKSIKNEKYVSLETFRKNGEGVKTPVWIVDEGDKLFVWTQADSWKAKRIGNNNRVRLAPCDMRGNVSGKWVEGEARILSSPTAEAKVRDQLKKKYGWSFRFFQLMGSFGGQKERVSIELIPAVGS